MKKKRLRVYLDEDFADNLKSDSDLFFPREDSKVFGKRFKKIFDI